MRDDAAGCQSMIAELVNREFCELLVNDTTLLLFAGERTAFESQAVDHEPVAVDRELRRPVEQHLAGRLGPQRDRLACVPLPANVMFWFVHVPLVITKTSPALAVCIAVVICAAEETRISAANAIWGAEHGQRKRNDHTARRQHCATSNHAKQLCTEIKDAARQQDS